MDILVTLKQEEKFVRGRMHPFDREFFIVGEQPTQQTVLKYVYWQLADFVAAGAPGASLEDMSNIHVVVTDGGS